MNGCYLAVRRILLFLWSIARYGPLGARSANDLQFVCIGLSDIFSRRKRKKISYFGFEQCKKVINCPILKLY